MTAKTWYSNPGNQEQLTALLNNPILKGALELIRDEASPKPDGIELIYSNRTAADAAFALACIQSTQAGMLRVLSRLDQLSKPKVDRPKEVQPNEHITLESLTAAANQ